MTRAGKTLREWAQAFWRDCGLAIDVAVFDSEPFTNDLTVRLRDRDTDILWRFTIAREFVVSDSKSAEAHVVAYFEERELQIRQATFYVHHCREVLRAVQQERHERYMQQLLEMKPEAQA